MSDSMKEWPSEESRRKHYESKRDQYMLPPEDAGLIDEFTIYPSSATTLPSELQRQVSATMCAFWQADAAYKESEAELATLCTVLDKMREQAAKISKLLPSEDIVEQLKADAGYDHRRYDLKPWLTDAEIIEFSAALAAADEAIKDLKK